jgi:hypothetical protein
MRSADETAQPVESRKDYRDRYQELTGVSLRLCPVCHRGHMIRVDLPTIVTASSTSRDTS